MALNRTNSSSIVKREHNSLETANIIFDHFIMHQSTTVRGMEIEKDKIHEKGDLVIKALRQLSKSSMKKLPSSETFKGNDNCGVIGKPTGKAFKYKKEVRDGLPAMCIWRIQ